MKSKFLKPFKQGQDKMVIKSNEGAEDVLVDWLLGKKPNAAKQTSDSFQKEMQAKKAKAAALKPGTVESFQKINVPGRGVPYDAV